MITPSDSLKTNPIKPNFIRHSLGEGGTKPIQTQFAEMSKIDVNLVKTRNYNNEQRTMNYELLCKTNPIKPNLETTPRQKNFEPKLRGFIMLPYFGVLQKDKENGQIPYGLQFQGARIRNSHSYSCIFRLCLRTRAEYPQTQHV